LVAEAANIDIDGFRQLAREITNVHTGAAVNVRRIFVGEEQDLHVLFLNALLIKRTQFYLPERSSKTGISTACRTLSAVAP